MKTLMKVMRRYVLLAVGAICLIFVVNIALLLGLILYFGLVRQQGATEFYGSQIADAFTLVGGRPDIPPGTLENWDDGWAWGMMLDDDGNVIWQYDLPQEQNHRYTATEVLQFARWYLDDYPVLSYVTDYGILVLAREKGSMARWNFYMDTNMAQTIISGIRPALLLDLILVILLALLVGWRSGKALRQVGRGIDELAEGRTPALPERGMTAELAQKLNCTGALLQKQAEQLARRDSARTSWIAGVSHDIRTPLALIMGYAEQLAADAALPAAAREKAEGINRQGARIKALIEDLNLTSKLQYGAQPLRCERVQAGKILRSIAAEFCDSPAAAGCELDFDITPAADIAAINADAALLGRAIENLLNNSARHNPPPVKAAISAAIAGGSLMVTITDDGAGYPLRVLAALQAPQAAGDNAPHILGLHVVEQIIAAHGGKVRFAQNAPTGAKTVITLPLA